MRMYDIIEKKRDNKELSKKEWEFFIKNYVNGDIPDYQASALLMAIYLNGMTDKETYYLTELMVKSGETIDLSSIDGIKVDKHSTGGVGDKTTFIVGSIVASLGVPAPKMSGRGLGYTGGTIDKMESIPGLRTSIGKDDFLNIVKNCGMSVISQTGNLVPADKKLYALRDVTATIDCMPLIVSSIMSKKIASGADAIVLDVKTGKGAFMKTPKDSIRLAEKMVAIGSMAKREVIALITNMDAPLGNNVGNSLEMIEVAEVLKGQGPSDLLEVCLEIASNMLFLAKKGDIKTCREMAVNSIKDKSAFKKLKEMVTLQGGDSSVLDDYSLFKKAKAEYKITADSDGYINSIDAQKCGEISVLLGAGRSKKEDVIDHSAGITLNKKTGDIVKKGDTLAVLYSDSQEKCESLHSSALGMFKVDVSPETPEKLIYAKVTKKGTKVF